MVFQNYALYPHMTRRRQHGLRAQDRRHGQGRDPQAGRRGRQILDLDAVPRPQAEGPLRWPASARRHGPGHRPAPAGVPHGRAAVEPRRQAPRADPHPDRLAAAPARRHHGLRHARPGRGHDHGRPGRRAQGRPAAAGRHPAPDVRPPEQRLRGRLHRLAGDEPARAPRRSTAASPSARASTRSRARCSRQAKGGNITVGVRPEDLEVVRQGHPGRRSSWSRSSAPTPTCTARCAPARPTPRSSRGSTAGAHRRRARR